MKRPFKSITLLALGLISTAVLVSCNNKEQPKAGTPSVATDTQKSELVVYVNSDSLLSNYDYFKDLKTKFEDKSKKTQADLNSKGVAFQQEVAAYQKNAATLSADQRASTEQRLARKQQELSSYNQNASNALANEEAGENEKLYNKVSDFLKVHAKAKGYKLVLTYSKSNPTVLFADDALDVTKEVVSGLNDAYKTEKK